MPIFPLIFALAIGNNNGGSFALVYIIPGILNVNISFRLVLQLRLKKCYACDKG